MKKYPKIGIRPIIDGRQGGVRESLEEKTMNLAKAVANLISTNLRNGDGSPVECVIADGTIGRVAESAACAEKFELAGVGSTISVTSCWCYGSETMDMNQGMPELDAEVISQRYNIYAMIIFCCSRFICTYFLKYIDPGRLLMILAIAAGCFTVGVIGFQNIWGLYCLVAVSACMSLMFPTIYGISLKGLGDDAKFGAAGLIMAILGGSILPPVQASIIDLKTIGSFPAVNLSFILPFICFLVIIVFGIRSHNRDKRDKIKEAA